MKVIIFSWAAQWLNGPWSRSNLSGGSAIRKWSPPLCLTSLATVDPIVFLTTVSTEARIMQLWRKQARTRVARWTAVSCLCELNSNHNSLLKQKFIIVQPINRVHRVNASWSASYISMSPEMDQIYTKSFTPNERKSKYSYKDIQYKTIYLNLNALIWIKDTHAQENNFIYFTMFTFC